MRVATAFSDIACEGPVLLTIGTFDGVHRGHRFLLEQAQQRAREHSYSLVIVTFDPSPAVVLRPNAGRYQLITASQKLRLLEEFSPALTVLLPFTRELATLTANQFLDALEGRLRIGELWMGEDFHFGHDREGGLNLLVQRGQQDGFAVHVVARRMEDQGNISSTRVREALVAGDVEGAMPLLGRPFALDLTDHDDVEHLRDGLPGLQASIAPHLVLPASGVYAVLRTGGAGGQVPAVAEVRLDATRHQVRVRPLQGRDLPCSIEFIQRLAGGPDGQDVAALYDAARAALLSWQRPVYPAAGDY
ncbi:MAG TPA: FAD synthetase family protein [Chloroflexota bacterium]|nr:FAD synthetase family protein [Chloroflexota bacterium]